MRNLWIPNLVRSFLMRAETPNAPLHMPCLPGPILMTESSYLKLFDAAQPDRLAFLGVRDTHNVIASFETWVRNHREGVVELLTSFRDRHAQAR